MPMRKQRNRRPKKQKKRRPVHPAQDRISRRLKTMGTATEFELHPRAPGKQKISQVILAFAKPLLDEAPGEVAKRNAIEFAIIAWNLCIIRQRSGETSYQDALNKLRASFATTVPKEFIGYLEKMIDRKRELFAGNLSFVMGHEISISGNDVHLSVASAEFPGHGNS